MAPYRWQKKLLTQAFKAHSFSPLEPDHSVSTICVVLDLAVSLLLKAFPIFMPGKVSLVLWGNVHLGFSFGPSLQ